MNSPPVGAGATPPSKPGTWIDLYPASSAADLNHDPFSAKAYSPVRNSSQLVPWVLESTEFGASPLFTQSVQSARACSACARVEFCQVCSGAPEPRQELERALLRADSGEGDSLLSRGDDLFKSGSQGFRIRHCGDVNTRSVEHGRVVVQPERVRADRHSVVLPVNLAGAEDVLLDVRDVETVVLGGGEQPRVSERRDLGVVDHGDVWKVAGGCCQVLHRVAGVACVALDRDADLAMRRRRSPAPRSMRRRGPDTDPRACTRSSRRRACHRRPTMSSR